MSHIFNLGPSSFFMCFENEVQNFYNQCPDFWHEIRTKT